MTDKKSIKDITAMAKKVVEDKGLTDDMTSEMQASILAVTDQIERLSRNNPDLKALVQQVRGVIGKEDQTQADNPDQTTRGAPT
jgi:hypothetical protein